MNKKLGIGIVVIAIVAVAMFTGCVEEEAPASTPNPSPTPTSVPEPKYSRGDVLEIPLTECEIIPIIYNHTTGKNYTTNKKVILDYSPLADEYKITCVLKEGDEYYFCPEDTIFWLDRFSLERNVSAKITNVNLLTVKSWEDYQAFLRSSFLKHLPVKEIKSKANEVGYNDLMRYNEEWVGEIIYCIGLVVQVMEISDDRYALRVYVTPQGLTEKYQGRSSWTNAIWVNYEGTRLLEDDLVDIWGEVKGLKTYESVGGSEITIPEIDALHIELIAEAGEEWWGKEGYINPPERQKLERIRDKLNAHWKRLGYI